MALWKGFLQSKIPSTLTKSRIAIGAIIGLLLTLSIYSLQYMTREVFRANSIYGEDIWLLSDAEVNFYNLVFAFIAVIVGQSFCFAYWFDRPSKVFGFRATKLRSIVHEQRFFNWYVLAWYSKLGTVYALLFGMGSFGGYYVLSLYPKFNHVLILIIIVMFLQTWNTLLFTFRKRALKWMLISSVIVSLLALGISKINIVDYQSLNDRVINQRLEVMYDLRLPEANAYQTAGHRFASVPTVSIVKQKKTEGQGVKPLLFIGNTETSFTDLSREIAEIKSKFPLELQIRMPVYVKVDKEAPMAFVRGLEKHLAAADIQWINYLVIPKEAVFDQRYYMVHERAHLPTANKSHPLFNHEAYYEKFESYSNNIIIQVSKDGYEIDDSMLNQEDLIRVLKKKIELDPQYAIKFNFAKEITFESYFGAISGLYDAVFLLRDQQALKVHKTDFNTLKNRYLMNDVNAIKQKYPLRYLEVWAKEY